MKFSTYRRLREEKEQDTSTTPGALSTTEEKKTAGRKFSDIVKEREPERYARMVAKNVSDFTERVEQHISNSNMQAMDATDYINKYKDTYTLDAQTNASKRKEISSQIRQQTYDLMEEARNNPYLDAQLRQEASFNLLKSLYDTNQADKASSAFADYMQQFDSKEAFDRTRAAQRKQEETDAMTPDELRRKIEETNSSIGQLTTQKERLETEYANNALMSSKIGVINQALGWYTPSNVSKDEIDSIKNQIKELENDISGYENAIFQKEQTEALGKLTDETKDAFEKLYVLETEGYTKGFEKVLDNLSGSSLTLQRTYEDAEREKAASALEEQGIAKDEFDSLYEYYKFARDTENTETKVDEWIKNYDSANALKKIGMNVGTVLSTPVRGVTATQELVDSLHYKNEYAPLNINSSNYEYTNYGDTIRNATSQSIDNDTANFLYQTGMSMADFATLLPLSAATGSTASLAIMGTNAGTSAAKEATLRGVSKEQALMTALAAGNAEVVFEKMSLDHFWDIARKQGKAATRNAFLNIAAQAGIEGSEEVLTDIANTFTDELINRGLSEWYQNMDAYYKQGMSMEDAKKAATVDYCKQLSNSFWGGALSGGVFGTGAVVKTSLTGKKSTMTTEDYLQFAEGIDTERDSYMSQEDYDIAMNAQQLAQELSQKDNVTAFEKGLFEQATAELENIDWANTPKEQIRQIAATISNETVSRAFLADYKEGMPVETYARAFDSFYESGYTELPFERALEANDYMASVIDKSTLYGIYCLGQNQAAIVSEQYTNQEQKELVNTMANALGIKVEYQDIPGANGMYKDGTIYIANKTTNPSMVVMSHELTHHLKATVSEEYAAYENYVIDYFKEYHAKDYESLYASMAEHYGDDESLIREEIAANAAETFLTDADAVSQFVKQNRTIAERIADFLNNFITKLKEVYQNYTAKGQAGKMLAEDIEVYEKARDLWYEAVNAGQDAKKEDYQPVTNNSDNGNIKLSLKDYDLWDKKNPRVKFHVSKVSEPLKSVGVNKNRDIYFDSKKIIKIKSDHPEMTDDVIKNVDKIIKEPIAIMNSASVAGRITLVGELEGENGVPVLLALELHPSNSKGIEVEEIKICSAYTKDNFLNWFKNQDFLWINPNKNKTDTWLKRTRVQFPVGINQYGLIKMIPQNEQDSNPKFSRKFYEDEIGLRFSTKEGGELFESIVTSTDNMDYDLVDDGSEATTDLLQESARILQDGIAAARKIQDINISKNTALSMAKRYLNKYDAAYEADTFADNLYHIFAYIQKTENVNYQDMVRIMQEVCKPVLATSQKVDKEKMKEYTDFRKKVKSYHLRLNAAQKKEIADVYGRYSNFENTNKKRYGLSDYGYYLNSVWDELVEASGYALSFDTPDSRQMLELHDYMTSLEKAAITPAEDMNISQLAYDMALNIYTDYFKLVGDDNKKLIKQIREQMDKQLEKYKSDVKKDYNEQFKKRKQEVEIKKQDEINRLQQQIRELQRERDTALYEADELIIKTLDGDINALEYKIGKISERNAEKLAQLKVQGYNRSVRRVLTKQQTEIKNHIKKNMFDLQNRLAKPKENKFIPQGLVRATIALCEAVNIDTGRSEKLAERLGEMSHLYARMKEDKDYALASEYDEQTQAAIERLQEVFTGRNITMLNIQELKEVDDLVTQLRFQIINAGKLINMEKSKEVYEAAIICMDEINAAKSYNPNNCVSRGLNHYNTSMLSPKRQFRRMSGYKDDSVLNQIYEDLNNGQQKQMQVLMETARIFDPVTSGEYNQKAVSKLVGKEKKDWIDIGLRYKDNNPVMVPRAFRVSLAMHIQNKSNLDHIIYGGLTIPEPMAYQRGDFATAYATGKTIYFIPDGLKSVEDRKAAYIEAVKKLQSIVAEMTPYERGMVKCAETFFHEYTGKKINETSLQLNGYKKARVHNYFPIRTDPNFQHSEIEGLVRNGALEHMPFLNNRVGARNPILLEDITQVIQRQSENVAKYYGLAIPIRNFNKIYNTTRIGYLDSTKSVIARKWGVTGQKYIENLITDLQTKRGEKNKILDTLQGNFAQSVLSGNLSVAAQQIVAYPTAAATLGWDAVLKGFKYIPTKLDMEHIAKYTPLLWYRDQGHGTDIGDVNKSQDLMSTVAWKTTTALEHHDMKSLAWLSGKAEQGIKWEMSLLQKIDTKAVGSLWKASEIYVQETMKILPEQGEDYYYQEVAKVFNNCVDDTQANYATMQRPDILRNPNKAWKMVFLFKTQPLQNFNIMYDAYGNLCAKAERYKNAANLNEKEKNLAEQEHIKAQLEFKRAVSSQLAAAALVFVMKFLANAITHRMDKYRNEEDDITGWEIIEELVNEVFSNIAGSVLMGSEIYSFLRSMITGDNYYGIGIGVLDAVNDFMESLLKFREEPSWENLKQIYFDAGVLFGVPGENMYKFFSGIGLHIEDFVNGEPLSFKAGHETKLSVQYTTMMNALVDGNTKRYEERYAETMETLLLTKTEAEAKTALVSGIKGKLRESYLESEISYNDTIAILEKLEDKEPYFTIKAWDNLENEEYKKYSELEAAVVNGTGIDEEMAELTKNGIKEETALQNLIAAIKKAYKEGTISKEQASRYLKTYKEEFTDDDAYWQIRAWDKEDSYKELGENYSKYDDLLNAVESGNFDSVVEEYLEHGNDAASIKLAISKKYRTLYQEAYLKGDYKTVNAIKKILQELRVNGKRIYNQDDYLNWNKQAKMKAKENND